MCQRQCRGWGRPCRPVWQHPWKRAVDPGGGFGPGTNTQEQSLAPFVIPQTIRRKSLMPNQTAVPCCPSPLCPQSAFPQAWASLTCDRRRVEESPCCRAEVRPTAEHPLGPAVQSHGQGRLLQGSPSLCSGHTRPPSSFSFLFFFFLFLLFFSSRTWVEPSSWKGLEKNTKCTSSQPRGQLRSRKGTWLI